MAEAQKIKIEVAFALPDEQHIIPLNVVEGTTLEQAIELSGFLERHPELEIGKVNKVGIFGKTAKLDRILQQDDRVEIYRPLIADPKEVRRKRAAEGKAMTKGAAEKSKG